MNSYLPQIVSDLKMSPTLSLDDLDEAEMLLQESNSDYLIDDFPSSPGVAADCLLNGDVMSEMSVSPSMSLTSDMSLETFHHLETSLDAPDPNNNSNENEGEKEGSQRGAEKYSLRPRASRRRIEVMETVRGRRRGENEKKGERKESRPKPRPPPLSKYRRKTANARERDRMREINAAFELLRRAVPTANGASGPTQSGDDAATPPTTPRPPDGEKLTKITTLRLAMRYITALSQLLQQANEEQQMHEQGGDAQQAQLMQGDAQQMHAHAQQMREHAENTPPLPILTHQMRGQKMPRHDDAQQMQLSPQMQVHAQQMQDHAEDSPPLPIHAQQMHEDAQHSQPQQLQLSPQVHVHAQLSTEMHVRAQQMKEHEENSPMLPHYAQQISGKNMTQPDDAQHTRGEQMQMLPEIRVRAQQMLGSEYMHCMLLNGQLVSGSTQQVQAHSVSTITPTQQTLDDQPQQLQNQIIQDKLQRRQRTHVVKQKQHSPKVQDKKKLPPFQRQLTFHYHQPELKQQMLQHQTHQFHQPHKNQHHHFILNP